MKKIFWWMMSIGAVLTFLFTTNTFAQTDAPDGFAITLNPENFDVNEAVDLTITAVKGVGTYTDYVGYVLIEIIGLVGNTEYVVPSDGLYSFTPQDQGSKLFSKGLQIYKAGTYTLRVYDVVTDIKGETTIIIGDDSQPDPKEIDIISPISEGVERQENLNIIGSSIDLPNTSLDIYLNNKLINSVRSDTLGEFNSYLDGATVLKKGTNEIQIKAYNVNKELIGLSEIVVFTYEPKDNELFKSIEIQPSTLLKQGDTLSVVINVAEGVNSASLELSDGSKYPLDKLEENAFSKSFVLENPGLQNISISINYNGEEKIFPNVESIVVEEFHPAANNLEQITNVKVITSPIQNNSINISWDNVPNYNKYRLLYGTGKDELIYTVDVDSNNILIENIDPGATYYFQINILDAEGNIIGEGSHLIEYSYDGKGSCTVQDIQIQQKTIEGSHFLVRDVIPGAIEYYVYKSSNPSESIADMNKIANTTDTQFEYPFDLNAEQDEYVYYAVSAICADGQEVQINNIKKVKVGPLNNIILILILAGLLFSIYKVYRNME